MSVLKYFKYLPKGFFFHSSLHSLDVALRAHMKWTRLRTSWAQSCIFKGGDGDFAFLSRVFSQDRQMGGQVKVGEKRIN